MYSLAIDQGTTGTTTVLCDRSGRIVDQAQQDFPQIYPQPGWVEHDPMAIWQTVIDTVQAVCARSGGRGRGCGEIAAVGITNQRETTVVWDANTGKPIHNAIVWQCRRTAELCDRLHSREDMFRRKTGLPVDAYFSGTKIRWLLDHVNGCKPEDLRFGTIDSWLIWQLTNGNVHATDYTNASRTLLFDIVAKRWDEELCELVGVPTCMLPDVRQSIGDYGVVESIPALKGVPICGVAGDQQAALFGQMCFKRGQIKNTYGTGCFALMNTGDEAVFSTKGLITTLAVSGAGDPCYAMEGSVFIAGAAIQWLRDELGILESAVDSDAAARAVRDNAGVYLVPAFVGLGAPHWDMEARGTLVGLTRGANRNHVVRAALESMAYQTRDVLVAMHEETGIAIPALAADGGAAANDFLMQFQADVLGARVVRPAHVESTALGAAYLAGLKAELWSDCDELSRLKTIDREFVPAMADDVRERLLAGWAKALRQAMTR